MLNKLNNEDKAIKIDTIPITSSCNYSVYLEKSFFKQMNVDQYFIKIYRNAHSGTLTQENMGYIYFYLDPVSKKSSYIGTYVKPEFRSLGLASLLAAYWIKICLDGGYDFLTTNKTQRKPYLLYILKKSFFEIDDPEEYNKSKYTIHICRDNSNHKLLLFKNDKFASIFQSGKIFRGDNHKILYLEDLNNGVILNNGEDGSVMSSEDIRKLLEAAKNRVQLLDTVLLSNPYTLRDNNTAYDLSVQKISNVDEIAHKAMK